MVRWGMFVLLLGNLALAGYLVFIDRGSGQAPDVRALELNADKVKLLNAPGAQSQGRACLEWSKLSAADLKRAEAELAKLDVGKFAVRNGVITIAEPSSAMVARVTELKAGFAGTELKAVVCAAGS